ncbi:hypothetical protein J2M53_13000 [Arthrobacter sp. zg-ZUI100]|uniref:glycosyltransferase n=1 Tax=Arthrobacter jiangjiafuii TaxID=2817475 RepID=UPI001AED3C8A|nr:glycosyltransferase [Arthrobacter jiangjiafuii]MBP3037162.1 hypothetical protein [Arthrobacter jiangjiafuii]
MDASPDSVWVTFDTEQSRSMLEGKNIFYVPYISPRDWRGTLRAYRLLAKFLRGHSFDAVYSTGAAVALAAFLQPRLRKVLKTYIESVSRTEGPSLTGRMVSLLPSVRLLTQHRQWANGRWKYTESILSEYVTKEDEKTDQGRPSLFVTLGTIKPYRFDSLVDAVIGTGLADENTIWQLGSTARSDLPGRVYAHLPAGEFKKAALEASVVITHAGVGTVVQLLDWGKSPVVVPREKSKNEHTDNHQFQISDLLVDRKLAVVTRAHELSATHLKRAMKQRTEIHE